MTYRNKFGMTCRNTRLLNESSYRPDGQEFGMTAFRGYFGINLHHDAIDSDMRRNDDWLFFQLRPSIR
ncbi:MAG: hypothetical protein HY960_06980 [Ignavibacteriae bacterium]|nr:hypothetical protein [Ignavibacteriota bacterium]